MKYDKFVEIEKTYGVNKSQILKIKDISNYISKKLRSDPKLNHVYVIGELIDLGKPASGHIYFKLKDDNSILSCTFFKHMNKLQFDLETGKEVLVLGSISTYNNEYQLDILQIFPIGEGMQAIMRKKLIARLEKKGLFKKERKKPVPKEIKNVGLITGKNSAAYSDVIKIIKTKFPFITVLVKWAAMQGEDSPKQIIEAIHTLNKKDINVILLVRGGGGEDNLTTFDNENLVNEISKSNKPIITGIGHEINLSIVDMVADLSMSTPTKAAECFLPDKDDIIDDLEEIRQNLIKSHKLYLERREKEKQLKATQNTTKIYKIIAFVALIIVGILILIILKIREVI